LRTTARPQAGSPEESLSRAIGRFRFDISHSMGYPTEDKEKLLRHLADLEHRAIGQLPRIVAGLEQLYGTQNDVPAVLESMLQLLIARGLERPDELKALDEDRAKHPDWFISNKSVGAALYVDRHCTALEGLAKEIDLFKVLNVSMLHLMPTIYKTPEQDNDGGYAISDFRTLNPAIGTMEQLRDLFSRMRKSGISPIMDVTVNHVAHDHAWARAAKQGDADKLGYFFAVNEKERDEYEKHLNVIFPDIRPGNFTWNEEVGRFIWTTFMSSQWDLNYSNPKTLMAMGDELMFLVNQGAEVLRLDAVRWLWKEKGTNCVERPEVQTILGLFNSMMKIAAPGTVLLAEAICEPENLKQNLAPDRCQMAYSTLPLVHLWDALAHEDASFMAEALGRHANTPVGTGLLNLVRTHDDINFCFDPASAAKLGVDVLQRHQRLREFYLGDDSYAKGIAFSENNKSGKVFLNGTTGSLAGVERALEAGSPELADAAVRRIRLLNGVLLGLPGIPMINLMGGDDRGQINDYSYLQDEVLRKDSRWSSRVKRDVDYRTKGPLELEVMERVFNDTVDLNRVRTQELPAFGKSPLQVVETGNAPVLGFIRGDERQKVMVLANFSDKPQKVGPACLLSHDMTDVVDKIGPQRDQPHPTDAGFELAPYQCMWLVPTGQAQASA
jgi:amylosucrase